MSGTATTTRPSPSALTSTLHNVSAKAPTDALPLEILHNLQHQHSWTDLRIHSAAFAPKPPALDLARDSHSITSSPSPALRSRSRSPSPGPARRKLITGLPPRHVYIHPDLQAQLIHSQLDDSAVPVPREYVLPLSLGEKWSLRRFAEVFDSMPSREPVVIGNANGYRHQDAKRILLAMLAHNGMGGDGTVVYYIMQEGEVKPRQN